MEAFSRLARYWDLIANSGRFKTTIPLLVAGPSPFAAFQNFSDWLWRSTQATNRLTPEQLTDEIFEYACTQLDVPPIVVRARLLDDYRASGARGNPQCLHGEFQRPLPSKKPDHLTQRQARHQSPEAVGLSRRITGTN